MDSSELNEKDFISEKGRQERPKTLYYYLLLVIFGAVIGWHSDDIFSFLTRQKPTDFNQITNRDFSLFLWQNPQYLRNYSYDKDHYLTGFSKEEGPLILLGKEEKIVVAPPEIIYNYHYWNTFALHNITRTINQNRFSEFLDAFPIWIPSKIPHATPEYLELEKKDFEISEQEFLKLQKNFPINVKEAFWGWFNYYFEGEAINTRSITYGELRQFVKQNPQFQRNIWQNILINQTPLYLVSLHQLEHSDAEIYPQNELSSLIRVSYHNWSHREPQ